MFGMAENLRIKYRPGQHHGFLDVDRYSIIDRIYH